MLRTEARVKDESDETGWISTEDLTEIVKEETAKLTQDEKLLEHYQDNIIGVMLLKSSVTQIFIQPIQTCLKTYAMSTPDTVFAILFAAAHLNISAETSAAEDIKSLHTKESFLKSASIAYDYMGLHQKSMMKASGRHPPNDN